MPAPVLKFVTIFELDLGYGWSEIHYKQASSDNPNLSVALDNFVSGVATPRAGLLGESSKILGVRVSYPRQGAIASLPRALQLAGSLNQPSSNAATSLAIGFTDGSFTKSKIVHLRGFWDSVEANGGYQPELGVTWQSRLDAWKAALFSGYGWLSKSPGLSAAGPVTGYVQATTGIVTFTLGGAGLDPSLVGTRQQVRFSKFHASKSPLNRSLLVTVATATSLVTVQPIGCDPTTSTGHYNFRATSFVGYNAVSGITVGERRMGRPLGRYPGRLPAKARW